MVGLPGSQEIPDYYMQENFPRKNKSHSREFDKNTASTLHLNRVGMEVVRGGRINNVMTREAGGSNFIPMNWINKRGLKLTSPQSLTKVISWYQTKRHSRRRIGSALGMGVLFQ